MVSDIIQDLHKIAITSEILLSAQKTISFFNSLIDLWCCL